MWFYFPKRAYNPCSFIRGDVWLSIWFSQERKNIHSLLAKEGTKWLININSVLSCDTFLDLIAANIESEAKQEREVLTPYSFRHRFAYYGHHRPQEDGMYRSPKKIAEAMGHEYETHLLSYARFNTKDLEKSFDREPMNTRALLPLQIRCPLEFLHIERK